MESEFAFNVLLYEFTIEAEKSPFARSVAHIEFERIAHGDHSFEEAIVLLFARILDENIRPHGEANRIDIFVASFVIEVSEDFSEILSEASIVELRSLYG